MQSHQQETHGRERAHGESYFRIARCSSYRMNYALERNRKEMTKANCPGLAL